MKILSLGAGVQSSALLLMADEGRFGDRPDRAIFADTQDEPQYVYDHLTRLRAAVSIPVDVVTAGRLSDDLARGITTGSRVAQPPLYAKLADGTEGPLRRICTREYKVDVITKHIRLLLGYQPRQRIPANSVEQWFGISLDEAAMRMRSSDDAWVTFRYPLVEIGMDRRACEKYLRERGWTVKKSACVFCPYKRDSAWRDLRNNHPEEWAKAIAFDKMIRTGLPGVENEAYVHRSLKPLDEVDLTTLADHGQGTFEFAEDCESGVCGV